MKDWLFISDAHLSESDSSRQERLIDFLERNRSELFCLVILGDLFEFWFGFPGYINPAYRPICDTLRSLSRQGVRLIYLEGNHDFFMGSYFKDDLGCEVYPRSHLLELAGKKVFLSHGDGVNPGDVGYRLFRRLLKNRCVYAFIRMLGPARAEKLKAFLSRHKWMHRPTFSGKEKGGAEEGFALKQFSRGADVVILGHSHLPCRKTFVLQDRTCYYFNVGDWVENDSFLRYRPEQGFSLEVFDGHGRPESPVSCTDSTCSCKG
ncbi:MAG: UDP-2,3-diacylglucosamine diphosphatase [Deltaproteobacteria bacterium]|nr:UDP-2,3-diacylglucosamine diphosphatase [Deltaproteobacteria bacterium]